jgi:hypothetical protein
VAEIERLSGGRDEIFRKGRTVCRPAGFWSPSVHRLLDHLAKHGFHKAPKPLGFDGKGTEILGYIDGEVSNYPLSENVVSDEALVSSAQLLRAYHDAALSFPMASEIWMLPTKEPAEVICHGDFAPYNVVFDGRRAVGIIDLETAHPGPVLWDIAYALYRWAPFSNACHEGMPATLSQQIERGRVFCDAYGIPTEERKSLPELMIERLKALVDFMTSRGEAGDETFRRHIAEGHHHIYLADVEYIRSGAAHMMVGF